MWFNIKCVYWQNVFIGAGEGDGHKYKMCVSKI